MTRRGLRPLLVPVALLAALAFCGAGRAQPNCTAALLRDWRDGRIDGTYSVECYRTALKHLPEDLRIYSSAESDIQRALLASSHRALAARAKAQASTKSTSRHRALAAPAKAQASTKSASSHRALAAPAKAQASTKSASDGGGVSPFLVLAIAGVIVAALGSAYALVR